MKNPPLVICFLFVITLMHHDVTLANLDNFRAATLLQPLEADYPKERSSGRGNILSTDSGLVELTFMVDNQGSAQEVMVTHSSKAIFNDEAIKAILSGKFAPATLNDKPVDSRLSAEVEFVFLARDRQNDRGATSSVDIKLVKGLPDKYSSFYEKFNEEMQNSSPSQNKASALIKKMTIINHQSFYSLAYLSLAKFRFAEKFTDSQEVSNALKDLVAFDSRVMKKHQILKEDLKLTVLTALLKSQIESGHYAEALTSYKIFSAQSPKIKSMLATSIGKIESIKADSKSLTERDIVVEEIGYAHLPLLKRSFTLDQVNGEVSAFKLRCDTRFAELPYQVDAQYDIPGSWGDCHLQILAKEGTTAKLLQQ